MFSDLAKKFYDNSILHFVTIIVLLLLILFISYKAGVAISIMSFFDLKKHTTDTIGSSS